MKVETNRRPEPMDVVTAIEWGGGKIHVTLETMQEVEMRHMFARPRRLVGYAIKIFWRSLRQRTKYEWETVRDVLR